MRKKIIVIARYTDKPTEDEADALYDKVCESKEIPLLEQPTSTTDAVLWNDDRALLFMVEENVNAKDFSDFIKSLRKKYSKLLGTQKVTLVVVN